MGLSLCVWVLFACLFCILGVLRGGILWQNLIFFSNLKQYDAWSASVESTNKGK